MSVEKLTRDAVLRIGEVCAVDGRRINVLVDREKNLSDVFYDGDLLKNISVNSYIEIRKGFLSIIGRVEGEKIEEDLSIAADEQREVVGKIRRILTVSLAGYIDESGVFTGGTRELPLIGNEAYIVTRERIHQVHNLVQPGSLCIKIATIFGEEFEIEFPIDGLFNSHIAIFGNTGSGKSNTLAALYQELFRALQERNTQRFTQRTRFVVFDFNGEYTGNACLTELKTVYNLSTRTAAGDKLPMTEDGLTDIEVLAIIADATEKTQKPFLRRALALLQRASNADNTTEYVRAILCRCVRNVLQMSDKLKVSLLIDYFRQIFPPQDEEGDICDDLDWHNKNQEYKIKGTDIFLMTNPERIADTKLHELASTFEIPDSLLARIVIFLYIQLIIDVVANRASGEHIAPVINRLKSKAEDIDKLFDLSGTLPLWQTNVIVINMDDVNLDMKKTLPLLLARKLYSEHKALGSQGTLTIIVDEAHNILSKESFREAETWKDYRLETFEEIIKEGRKFGVFVTIASQRPNDISPTITSQAHNYFIHRLINDHDLRTIASAVSYIDRVTEESIPTLPTGTCVFSGVASQVPLKINIRPLSPEARPRSATRSFGELVPAAAQ